MTPLVEVLLGLMERWGYLLIFLLGVGEALPVVGVVIPGHALLLASGVAASAGILDIKWVILIAFAAGIVGDALSFWIARRWGRLLFDRYAHRVRIKPEHLEKSNAIFVKHGAFALVLVRFSFIARGLGPTLAGMSPMKWRTFWIYNVIGAAAWAVVNGLGGYYGGQAFFAVEGAVGRVLAYALLGALGIVVLYRAMRKYAPGFTRGDLAIALMGVASLVTFGIVASRLEGVGAHNALDARLPAWADALSPALPLFEAVRVLASPTALAIVSALLLGFLIARRWVWEAVLLGLGVGGIYLIAPTVRAIFGVTLLDEYPAGGQLPFPHMGAAATVVLAGVLAYLAVSRARHAAWWGAAVAGAVLLGLLAALAPLATREAYPTAAIGGVSLGLAWLAISILFVEFAVKRRSAARERASPGI